MQPLLKNRFFSGFSAEASRAARDQAYFLSYQPGEILFEEGAVADSVILVVEGEVEIFRRLPNQEPERFSVVSAGDYLGELSLLDGVKRSTGARALQAVQIAQISRESLRQVLAREPVEVTFQLFQRMYFYVRSSNERLLTEIVHKEKMQLVGEMASGIIHDFRNPLTGIKLATQLLENEHQDAKTRKYTNLIIAQAERMVQMAQELLDFSRGKPALIKEKIRMTDLLEKFQALNEDYLRHARVELTVKVPETTLHVDVGRILRVFQNLVSNAVDAMSPKGGVIEITGRPLDGLIEVSVRDEGPGIPEAIQSTLFEPFVTHGKKHGTGLGMAVVRSTVEAHGGRIRFETVAGKGTTFYFTLPVVA
jgi:signal transduction histidine kinase